MAFPGIPFLESSAIPFLVASGALKVAFPASFLAAWVAYPALKVAFPLALMGACRASFPASLAASLASSAEDQVAEPKESLAALVVQLVAQWSSWSVTASLQVVVAGVEHQFRPVEAREQRVAAAVSTAAVEPAAVLMLVAEHLAGGRAAVNLDSLGE